MYFQHSTFCIIPSRLKKLQRPLMRVGGNDDIWKYAKPDLIKFKSHAII